jgi:mannose-6-phosphate isomerase-like protein (cupin superfamily)
MSSKARSFTKLDAKPPVTAKAGQVLFIPAETVHAAKNVRQRQRGRAWYLEMRPHAVSRSALTTGGKQRRSWSAMT